MTIKALTVGGATIDVIASVASQDVERITMHNATASFLMLKEGEKVDADDIQSYVGGGATNAAVSMARQGLEVATLIKVGKDLEGDTVLHRLEKEGVDISHAVRDGRAGTGKAVMVSSHVCNPTIYVSRGVNTLLEEEDLTPKAFEGRDLVYVTGLSGASALQFPKVIERAVAAGATLAVNPGIRQLTNYSPTFLQCLKDIDILTLNTEEAGRLCGALGLKAVPGELLPQCSETPDLLCMGIPLGQQFVALKDFTDAMHGYGVKTVLVTNGAEGAYISSQGTIEFCPSQKVKVKGTAGAGDAYASTFAAQIVLGKSPVEAAQAAAVNAASVVGHPDTQGGLLYKDELAEKLDAVMTFMDKGSAEA